MRKNILLKRIYCFVLLFAVICSSFNVPVTVYADTDTQWEDQSDDSDICDAQSDIEEVQSELQESEDELGDNDTYIPETESVSEDTESDSDETSEYFLGDSQTEAKETLSTDFSVMENCVAGEDYVENEVIVECENEEDAQQIAGLYSEKLGAQVFVKDYGYEIATLEIVPNEDNDSDCVRDAVECALDMSNDLPAVYPNYYEELFSIDTTANEKYDPLTKNGTSNYQWFHEIIDDKFVWDEMDKITSMGSDYDGPLNRDFVSNLNNMTVAVIDTGIVTGHEDFNLGKIVGPYNAVSETEGLENVEDANGHGSNVAGIIGNTANDKGGRGIAAGVNIMPINVYKSDTNTVSSNAVLKALRHINEKASEYNIRVVNLSLGSMNYFTLLDKAIQDLIDKDIVVCAASGNYNSSMETYPASYNGVISVGSVNSYMTKSLFSNYGERLTVSAPGGDNGNNILINGSIVNCREYLYASKKGSVSGYSGLCGTSQASPVVAAAAALILANSPELSASEVANILSSSSTKINEQYDMGDGCINVARALGIETENTPVASIPSKSTIPDVCDVSLSIEGVEDLRDYQGMIYYTLDGSEPSLEDSSDSTIVYNSNPDNMEPIHLEYNPEENSQDAEILLKIRSCLFGHESKVSTYRYYFSTDSVRKITIVSQNGEEAEKVCVGATLKLKANILPAFAKNKKVKWESSNTSVATVSAEGVVRIVSEGKDNKVVITATAQDGSGKSDSFEINIAPFATNVEIDPLAQDDRVKLYNSKTVLLYVNEEDTYKLGRSEADARVPDADRKWHVWPSSALQKVIYKSSNTKVATVGSDGIIHAVGTGTATVTVSAADGSGKKDSINVKCVTSVSKIEIVDNSTKRDNYGCSYVVAGKTFKPAVIFNDNKSFPDNKELIWTVVEGSDYVKINSQTGVVTGRSNDYVYARKKVTIKAYSPNYCDDEGNNIYGEYSLYVYPITTSIERNGQGTEILTVGGTTSIRDTLGYIEPVDTLLKFSYKSSNPKVVYVNPETGEALGLKLGSTKITVTASDGSGKNITIPVKVSQGRPSKASLGLINMSGTPAVYPGKKLVFKAVESNDYEFDSKDLSWGFLNADERVSETEYLIVKDGTVTVKDTARKLAEAKIESLYAWLKVNGSEIKVKSDIEVFPSGVSSITIFDSNDISLNSITFDSIGDTKKISVKNEPEVSFGRNYQFSSTNQKIVTVDSKGVIKAIGNGTAYVEVLAGDNSKTKARCKVVVAQKPVSVTVASSNNQKSLASGKKLTLSAKINANQGEYASPEKAITWSLPNEADRLIASISKSGVLSAAKNITEQKEITVRAASTSHPEVYDEIELMLCPAVSKIQLPDSSITIRTSITPRIEERMAEDGTAADDYPESYVINKSEIIVVPEHASGDFSVISLNEKIATVEPVEESGEVTGWKIIPKSKGTVKIKAAITDGSGKSATVTVKVIKPVTNLRIEPKKGSYVAKAGTKLYLKSIMDSAPSNSKVAYFFTDPEMGTYASVNKDSGTISVKKASVIGTQSRTLSVYARALDKWQDTSEPIEITILPGIVLMKDLNVVSSTKRYDLAGGSSLQMKATTSTDATNKSIRWYLGDENGEADVSQYASITSKGLVKANSNIEGTKTIYAYAKAKDGGDACGCQKITLYSKAASFTVDSQPDSNVHTVRAGENLYLNVDTASTNSGEACCKYNVTYTTGAAKVYLCDGDNGAGTLVKVHGLSKGKTTVYFESVDGSKKKKSYLVNITQ